MKKDKINIPVVLLGADPELFLFSALENKHVTAIGLVGGTKDNPTPITTEGHFIQEDGVAAEFNIPPCATSEELINNIGFVRNYIRDTIATPNKLVLSEKASAIFTDEDLNCDQAQEIGCTPDINAWSLMMNSPEGYTSNLRAVGGHIHIGYNDPCEETSIDITRAMDLFLGVGSVLLDKDYQRRSLYGKAGAMRFKSFGVEYRTLSNFWIFDDKLIKWVFDNTIKALEFVNMGGIITNEDQLIECINTCNTEMALEIIEDYQIPMPMFNKELVEYVGAD